MAEKCPDNGASSNNNLTPEMQKMKDDELSALLDSSLNDFGKSTIMPELDDSDLAENDYSNPNKRNNNVYPTSQGFDPETTKRAAADFQKMLNQLASIQKVVLQQQQQMNADGAESSFNDTTGSSSMWNCSSTGIGDDRRRPLLANGNKKGCSETPPPPSDDGSPPQELREAFRGAEGIELHVNGHEKENHFEEEPEPADLGCFGENEEEDSDEAVDASAMAGEEELKMAHAFLENMQILAEKADKIQRATTEEEIANAMKELNDDETYESEFMPFMHGLMGSLLSKDILYPPMKDMCDKYPEWLSKNKEKLDEKTYTNYEKQLSLMKEVCQEFEQQNAEDSDQMMGERMERLISNMQKIQACGYPPEDLVGKLPPGWGYDLQTGLPKAEDMEKAAEACSII